MRWLTLILLLLCTLLDKRLAAAADQPELRLGFFPNVTHAQALYAIGTSYFEKQTGAQIHWTAFNAGPSAVEALFSGAIDASFVGPSPAINGYLKSHGEKFVIISGAASGGAALVVRLDAGIETDKDFGGKTIATPQIANTQDVAARLWLREKGYKLTAQGGTVNLIALANPDQLTSFKRKQIDAAWTIEPWVARLEIEGGGRIFLDEKELWPGGKYVTTQLVMSRSFLQAHREIARKLVQALVEVTQTINADKTAAGKVLNQQIQSYTSKSLSEAVLKRSLERVELTWDPVPGSLYKDANSAYQVGFIPKKPDLSGIYDLSLLNEVLSAKNLPTIVVPKAK